MPASLEWDGDELKLGPFTVAGVKREGPFWAATGNSGLGDLLKDLWQEAEDAKQDIASAVRSMLREQGVDCD